MNQKISAIMCVHNEEKLIKIADFPVLSPSINKEGNKSISFSKYELLFKKRINPIFVTKKEFELMLKDKEENIGKQVLKNHIILINPEEFWGCVLHAIR